MQRYLRTNMKLSRETRDAWHYAGFERVPFFAGPWGNPLSDDSILLNYGCSQPLYNYGGLVLNPPSLIHRTRVEELPKYIGEHMPIFTLDVTQPLIFKTNGRKGHGKLVVAEGSPVVVQRFLYPATEYRVVTWDIPGRMEPEVLAWSLKKKDDPLDPCSLCTWFYQPTYEMPTELRALVLDAHGKLGLNFVGWDVMHHEGRDWIIEANSAPGIGEETSRRLRKRLRKVFAAEVIAA